MKNIKNQSLFVIGLSFIIVGEMGYVMTGVNLIKYLLSPFMVFFVMKVGRKLFLSYCVVCWVEGSRMLIRAFPISNNIISFFIPDCVIGTITRLLGVVLFLVVLQPFLEYLLGHSILKKIKMFRRLGEIN